MRKADAAYDWKKEAQITIDKYLPSEEYGHTKTEEYQDDEKMEEPTNEIIKQIPFLHKIISNTHVDASAS